MLSSIVRDIFAGVKNVICDVAACYRLSGARGFRSPILYVRRVLNFAQRFARSDGAFEGGYKGRKKRFLLGRARMNIYGSVENDTDLWRLARLNPIPSHVASRGARVALLAVNCLFNIPQKPP